MEDKKKPTGSDQPAERPMKDRGTGAGVTETYGADVSQGATNKGGMSSGSVVVPAQPRMEGSNV